MKDGVRYGLLLLLIVLAALGLRTVLLLTCLNTVNADQAVFGLMAEHILKGKFFLVFWESKYGGTFIAYLAAINFKLFGASILSLRLATFPLVIIGIVYGSKLAAALYGRTTGLLAGLLMAISPVFVTLLSVSPHGVYAEALGFGPVVLYMTYIIAGNDREDGLKTQIALLGFISGLACWSSLLMVPFLLTSCFVLFFGKGTVGKKHFLRLAAFFALGAAPLVIYNLQHPFATLLTLGSRPLDVSKDALHADLQAYGPFLVAFRYAAGYLRGLPSAFLHVLENIPQIFKLANPLMEKTTSLYFLSGALYLAPVIYFAAKRRKTDRENIPAYLAGFSCLFALFGFLDNPRYLLPVWLAAAILLAAALVELRTFSRLLPAGIIVFILGLNLAGSLLCMGTKSPPYEKLAEYLLSKDLHWGYANYWTAFPVIFVSGEKVIVSPALHLRSVHPRSKNSYPFYTDRVDNEKKVFYIINDSSASAAAFEGKMAGLKSLYQKDPFPPFMIYHSFSRRLYPADLDLPPSVSSVKEPFFY